MTINEQLRSNILRYHFVEHWRVGTIATQLGVHHSSVERIISQAGMPKIERAKRASIIDPYLPFIHDTLTQYPKLSAARLYQMVQSRGYSGGPSHFRQWIAQLRPRKVPEAYQRLKTLPGEQAQMDWGHFGHLTIGRAKRPLMAFVIVMSYSRMVFLRFYLNAQMSSFLHGHVSAFAALGVPKVMLYDNLKSAVLQRHDTSIHFNPELIALSAHYRYEPRPVAVARGNEKGRVERTIRYIRDNFFAARPFIDLADLNAQADHWCREIATLRRCPGEPELNVAQAFEQEREQLFGALPDSDYDSDESLVVSVGKTPYARFDLNDYSVPHQQVRQSLSVRAGVDQIRIFAGDERVAVHDRHYGKGELIENPQHVEALRKAKKQARAHEPQHRLYQAAPASEALLHQGVERGYPLQRSLNELTLWLEHYGAVELQASIKEALDKSCYHTAGVLQVLERRRESQQRPVPLANGLCDKALDHPTIRTASLRDYDRLHESLNDEDNTSNTGHDDD